MLRVIAVIALVGCGGGSQIILDPDGPGAACPASQSGESGDTIDNSPCALAAGAQCFVVNDFSSCASAWYTCGADGHFHYDQGLGAQDGASCAGAPVSSCTTEGNPSCQTAPPSGSCTCEANGNWHCVSGCYETCPAEYDPAYNAAQCMPVGLSCSWPGHNCTCSDTGIGGGIGEFECV